MTRIDELLQQRAAIDAELRSLHTDAKAELEQAQKRLELIASALSTEMANRSAVVAKQSEKLRPPSPLDETDAGNGIPETMNYTTAEDFTDELAELRARSQARRRR